MKEIVEAIDSRIKSPYFGYAVIAFFALNWRGFFLLIVLEGGPYERLAAFDGETTVTTLAILPLLIGAAVAASTHWIRYAFEFISKKPLGLIGNLSLESEHKKMMRQTELEQSRTNFFAMKEKELIERAKRDEEVSEIDDIATKEKLTAQLETLRKERELLNEQINNSVDKISTKLSITAHKLLRTAANSQNGEIMKSMAIGNRSIQAGGISFGSNSQPEFVRYESALNELIAWDLVQEVGHNGDMFELTHKGWESIKEL